METNWTLNSLSSWVSLGGPLASPNQPRTIPCDGGESTQSSLCILFWNCGHLQIILGLSTVSISFPAWWKWWNSVAKNTDCQLLCFECDCNEAVSLYISAIQEIFPLPRKIREMFEIRGLEDEVNENKWEGIAFLLWGSLLVARPEIVHLWFAMHFCSAGTYPDGNYNIIVGNELQSYRSSFNSWVLQYILWKYRRQCLDESWAKCKVSRLEVRRVLGNLSLNYLVVGQGTGLKLNFDSPSSCLWNRRKSSETFWRLKTGLVYSVVQSGLRGGKDPGYPWSSLVFTSWSVSEWLYPEGKSMTGTGREQLFQISTSLIKKRFWNRFKKWSVTHPYRRG